MLTPRILTATLEKMEQPMPSLPQVIQEILSIPARLVISRKAWRAYLTTVLLSLTSLILYAISVATFAYLYYNHVPQHSLSVPIDLQFPTSHLERSHLFGISYLGPAVGSPVKNSKWISSDISSAPNIKDGTAILQDVRDNYRKPSLLVPRQPYEVSVTLKLPRTPSNVDAGNFMVDVLLLSAANITRNSDDWDQGFNISNYASLVLASARKPTTLRFRPKLIDQSAKVIALGLYVIGFWEDNERVIVQMLDEVEFGSVEMNGQMPRWIRVGISSTRILQVYECTVTIKAKLRGIKWGLYHHPFMAFMLSTTAFWLAEITCMLMVLWFGTFLATQIFSQRRAVSGGVHAYKDTGNHIIKEEQHEDDLSDTSRTFPTFSRQQPLHYSSAKPKMREEADGEGQLPLVQEPLEPAEEGDIEDELLDQMTATSRQVTRDDSGLGTSLESSGGGKNTTRRRKLGDGKTRQT